MSVRRSLLRTGAWLADAISITVPDPSVQVLVIPGNPGVCGFYEQFLGALHDAYHKKADVVSVSHLGHHAGSPHDPEVFCLNTQIQHKQLLLDSVLSKGLPTVVVAHSIGSYMVLQALQQLQQAGSQHLQHLKQLVLLMPFLATDWSSRRQVFLSYAACASYPLGVMAGLLGRLPLRWQQQLVQLGGGGGLEAHALQPATQLLRSHTARNAFHLAWHEFRDLNRCFDWQLLRALGSKVVLVAAPRDMWFPQHHLEELRSQAPDVQVFWREDLSHSFCVQSKQCSAVAAIVQQAGQQQQQQEVAIQQQQQQGSTAPVDLKTQQRDPRQQDLQRVESEADVGVLVQDVEASAKRSGAARSKQPVTSQASTAALQMV